MSKWKYLLLIACLTFLGCSEGSINCNDAGCIASNGNGGTYGTGDGTPTASRTNTGQVLLGPVIGATITVREFYDEEQTVLCQVTTSTVMNLQEGGTFSLPASCITNADTFYQITSTGGYDIDHDDNGIIDHHPTAVTEQIDTVVLGSWLYEVEGWKINRITDLFSEFAIFARDKLQFTPEQLIRTMPLFAIEHLSQNLDDVTGIDYHDVLHWNPRIHQQLIDFEAIDSAEVFFQGFWDDLKPVSPKPLNDTGYIYCADYRAGNNFGDRHNSELNCADYGVTAEISGIDDDGDPIPAGQDANFGRDLTNNDSSDGHAGFSFTKIDANGNPLSVSATSWRCVLDNITGLMWEVKTSDGGLQDKSYYYTWYNSTGINDGGDHGIGDTGITTTTGYEFGTTQETGYPNKAGSDNCYDPSRCDTEKYVADINAMNNGIGLCGFNNWRLPTHNELVSIVSYSNFDKAIDTDYFPNEGSTNYARTWTSTVEPGSTTTDRYRMISIVQFSRAGATDNIEKLHNGLVRLVRSASNNGESHD